VPKTEAESSCKSCVSAYKIKLYKDLEYHNQKIHGCEKIRSHNKYVL